MKKISIFFLAAMAMISCGNRYKAQDAVLTNETDSVNFALGMINGLQIRSYYLAKDSSDEVIAEFIDALETSYLDKEEELSEVAKIGRQFGTSAKMFEKKGLAENPVWTLNEKVFFQGVVNALYEDTTVMKMEDAQTYLMANYQTKNEVESGSKVDRKSVV